MGTRLGYALHPLALLLAIPKVFFFFLGLGLRFRVGTITAQNEFACAIIGILRRLRVFRRFVYISGDWGQGSTAYRGIWSHINKEVYFPVADWFCCKCSDLTVNLTSAISKSRTEYWGRKIPKEEIVYQPPLVVRCTDASRQQKKHKILFFGGLRNDSGLDLVVRSLPRVRERIGDVSIKIVGPITPAVIELKKAAAGQGLESLIDCAGRADRDSFDALFSDCYCGVNLITDPDSHTSKTLPSKVMDYFQYLLPVLVSPYVGPISETIRERKLGLVIDPEVDNVARALIELYDNQPHYVRNLQSFIETRERTNLIEILCPDIVPEGSTSHV
jgi:glycosyltransferase involved in cell wall biosynthesis